MKIYKEYIDYSEYAGLCNILVHKIKESEDYKTKQLCFVYGIPTGGLPLAVHLAKHLNLVLITDLNLAKFSDSKVLICDDISDTGQTISDLFSIDNPCGFEFLKGRSLIATICVKEDSIQQPDFYCFVVDPQIWVVFPWEDYNEEMIKGQHYRLKWTASKDPQAAEQLLTKRAFAASDPTIC